MGCNCRAGQSSYVPPSSSTSSICCSPGLPDLLHAFLGGTTQSSPESEWQLAPCYGERFMDNPPDAAPGCPGCGAESGLCRCVRLASVPAARRTAGVAQPAAVALAAGSPEQLPATTGISREQRRFLPLLDRARTVSSACGGRVGHREGWGSGRIPGSGFLPGAGRWGLPLLTATLTV